MRAVAHVESVRTSTEDLMPAVGFATRGISIRTLLKKMEGRRLPLHVALDIALSVARLIRAEHLAGRVLGALDGSRVALMENGAISLVAGGQRLAPELKSPAVQPTMASDIYALGTLLLQLLTGRLDGNSADAPTNLDVPEELIQLAQSCLNRDPKMRPSSMKNVEKALALHLSEPEMDEALAERVELVKQFAPEVPKHLVPAQPMVIATEDITGHNLVGFRATGAGPVKVIVALVVLLLVTAAGVWWWQFGRAAKAAPVPAVEVTPPPAPPKVEETKAEEPALAAPAPEAEPIAPPPPPEVKAAPVRVKKHRKR